MEEIIKVTQNKCKQCYSCVRNCPVNAIQIKDGQATIIHSRCISCGNCIKTCPQNAKIVLDGKKATLDILEYYDNVIACLAPSFVVSFHSYPYKKVVGALKELGFSEVWEVAVGAEELSRELDKYLTNTINKKPLISTPCPAFIRMIEKHYPEIIENLLPFLSPMIAAAKIIRSIKKDKDLKIVFIGPCIAKKAEAIESQFEGLVNSVLTFDEIKELFSRRNINLSNVKEQEFDSAYCNEGKLFPLSGGLLYNLKASKGFKESDYICIEDKEGCLELIDAISKGNISAKFVDVLMCKGCIEGPKIDSELNHYEKISTLYKFYEESKSKSTNINYNVDLNRYFRNRRNVLPYPTEEEIKEVLRKTNKYTKEDELNCGACGYNTCREKAIAVVQGIAEVEMCLPYLLSKKTKLNEQLSQKIKEITLLKEELETIIESSYDGLVVTDGEGKILMTNKAWNKMIQYNSDIKDSFVQEMEDKGIIFPSATLLALKEKRRISFVQKMKSGKEYLATATPIFNEDKEITRVVSNIRDIAELNRLKQQIEETKKLQKYHNKNDSDIDRVKIESKNIVANSMEFGRILQTASKVASVDSTILIFGESGVGKEVVAKFIHSLSTRKDNLLIKINCGAIPENLIESELFGYETGAFTGAKKKGKPGLIQLADTGTLFLDEIGEMPLNVQVKLLRVLQDKKFTPIGGTKEKSVDVRIIAATNRNLYDMVKKGEFRADLYYRLNVVPLEIPPLRKRKSDILPLCYHFLQIFNEKYGCNKELTSEVEKVLLKYSWPGNVRELENLVERIVVTTSPDVIEAKDLPMFLLQSSDDICEHIKIDGIVPLKKATNMLEKKLIERAYKKYNTTYEMAEALGVNQSTVVRKIQKYIKNNALEHN
ncbi:sigma 54-interacting transcriptional regulator [Caldisalinibacter kiritimatiensis]|uniref:HTH-type transcriptional regulatory protein TyrR n=1 Tax=Caldisalinibacter kiritimatiensis TaxID=1304284 RepID=R1CMY2_9FIRM|nr:sigma 54-interacting transcriptional regulator [Caldisalinibacter kiritimatiensis]EOD00051.1 Periplasmic [Fe] hydrogenase [Caldisalinibacter kiritimatiensis]